MTRSGVLLTSVCMATLLVGACTNKQPPRIDEAPPTVGDADINPRTRTGDVEAAPGSPDKLPTLDELKATAEVREKSGEKDKDEPDKVRGPALREAALSYGARGGLAWATREINRTLKAKADTLGQIFQFNRVMLSGPDGATVRPPVIVEAKDDYELNNSGQTLRLAENVYRIVQKAKFQPQPPRWQNYLLKTYDPPERPARTLLPKNETEQEIWRRHVEKGWDRGIDQAFEIFEQNMRRLERDFIGMITYRRMLARNMVSAPILAEGELGVTASDNGNAMRVNDRALRVTRDTRLVPDPEEWRTIVEDARDNLERNKSR